MKGLEGYSEEENVAGLEVTLHALAVARAEFSGDPAELLALSTSDYTYDDVITVLASMLAQSLAHIDWIRGGQHGTAPDVNNDKVVEILGKLADRMWRDEVVR